MNWIQDDMGYFANEGFRQVSVWREGKYWRWAMFVARCKVSGGRNRSLERSQEHAEFMLRRYFKPVQ
jgi:hypothetical protein